ncbi:MAG: glycosyltransferase family 39 protein [Anaerolineae bacterium]|nr:glycosyltransferase family 39 protein [Anaerolineae bacterium]
MKRWVWPTLLVLVLVVAAWLRLTHIDWDEYHHFHPDERYISWVATTIEWPDDLATGLTPNRSSFNPFYWPPDASGGGVGVFQDRPRDFAYGHLFLYLGVAASDLVNQIGPSLIPYLPDNWFLTTDILNARLQGPYEHITIVGRALAAIMDLGTIVLLYLLGKRLYHPAVGLLAGSFLALNVMHIQLSHFFTSDPFMTFFVVLALLGLVSAIDRRLSMTQRIIWLLVGAAAVGFAVGNKFSAVMLLLPLALTVWWMGAARKRQDGTDIELPGLSLSKRVLMLVLTGVIALVAFTVTNPFAVLDNTCSTDLGLIEFGPFQLENLSTGSCYFKNVFTQQRMVSGESDLPFVRQYAGTLPWLYHMEMQIKWGMGPVLGLLAFLGLAWAIYHAVRALWQDDGFTWSVPLTARPHWVILAWVVPFFLTTGGFYVKFMRYLQPIVPFLMLYAAAMLWQIKRPKLRALAITACLLFTALYALSFVNMYNTPHSWVDASKWIYRHVEPGAVILGESWDDQMPIALVVDDQYRTANQYQIAQTTWLLGTEDGDNEAKVIQNLASIAAADFVTLASNRVYGVVPRQPERYPYSSQFYEMLFDGSLGYDLAYVTNRSPNLAGIHLQPDMFTWAEVDAPRFVSDYFEAQGGVNWGRVDESFTVYDQPLVLIFENKDRLSAESMRALFVDPPDFPDHVQE